MNITTIAKWAVYVPLFTIPFLSLYIANTSYFPFITGKNFAFRALVEIAVAGWIVLALADKRYRPQFSLIALSFALLIGWMAVANAFALNPHKAFWSNFERMEGWVTIAHVFLFFLVAGSVFTVDKLWGKWRAAFVGAAAFVTGHGLLQMMGAAQIHQSTTRVDATLGNAEYLAGFLLFAIAFTLWQAFDTRAKEQAWLRYGLFALTALEVVILVGTLTRGTVVALVAAAGFGSLMWLFKGEAKSRKWAAGVLGAVVLLVGGLFVLRNSPIVTENPNLERFASIFSLREALGTRLIIWDMALEGAQERPVTGWGQEGFNYVFNKHYEPSLYGQEAWFDRAHNIYLDWLIAGGVPALLLFLALYGTAILAVARTRDLGRIERTILLAALVGYGVQGLVVFDNLFTYVPLAFLLAYAHARSAKPIPALDRLAELRGAKLDAIAAPAVAVLALVVVYMVNVPSYVAGKELIQGLSGQRSVEARLASFKSALAREPFATQEIREQLITFAQAVEGSSAPDALKQETLVFAATQMEEEIKRAPEDARLHILYAVFLREVGKFAEARAASARAHELSPRKQTIIFEQGIGAWQAGDRKAALAHFEEAHALAPESEAAAVYLAVGRIINGNVPAGKAVLTERFGTTSINHLILALAYQQAGATNDLIALLAYRYSVEKDAVSGYQLATAYAQAGRLAEARAQARAVMAAFPESASRGTALIMQIDQASR